MKNPSGEGRSRLLDLQRPIVQRWLTGLATAAALIGILGWAPVLVLALLVWVAAVFTLNEYCRMSFPEVPPGFTAFQLLAIVASVLLCSGGYLNALPLILAALIVSFLGCGFISVFFFSGAPLVWQSGYKILGAILHIPFMLSLLLLIRQGPNGQIWLFWVVLVTFMGDVAAYYIGTFKGRHKLWPAASPNKTIEGAIGGLAVNLLVGIVFKACFLPDLSWGWTLVMLVCMGIAGQVGDLYESILKRSAAVKDSGKLLPGHGGLFDRIDALLFAAPVAYFFNSMILT